MALLSLPPDPESVAQARHWVVARLRDEGRGELIDPVKLLVSELLTNVVRHARTPCDLILDIEPDRVRIEVRDGADQQPVVGDFDDPMALSGRGMVLVDVLSTEHGVEPLTGGGKAVWCELSTNGNGNGTDEPA